MLKTLIDPYASRVHAVLRIVAGLLFAFHGMQKVLGVLAERQPPVMSQMWIGGSIELTTGLLIAIGLFVRWAAFLASGTMAVAYLQFHWKFQFDPNFFPAVNGGELAVLYCFLFLYFAAKGSGPWSFDTRRTREP